MSEFKKILITIEGNIGGGVFSYKSYDNQIEELWYDLSLYLITENLGIDIVGLSITSKKNGHSVVKIWNKDADKKSLMQLNPDILKKWGTDIIYIKHVS